MRRFSDNGDNVFSTRRIEALTDGVVAIAMTLLVLDLHLGDLGDLSTSQGLWQALKDQHIPIAGFVVSFFLLGSMWAVHMRQFEYIKNTDRHLTFINTVRLFCVVLMPLTTSIFTSYSGLVLGRVLLPLNFLMLSIVSYWQWNYAVSEKSGLNNKVDHEKLAYAESRNKAILICAALTTVASIFIGALAFLVMILAMPLGRYLARRNG